MLNVIMTKSYLQPPQSASLATTIVDVEHATIELALALPERKVDSTMATRVEMKQRIWPRIILTDTRRRFATFLFYDKLRIEDKYTVVTQFDSFFFSKRSTYVHLNCGNNEHQISWHQGCLRSLISLAIPLYSAMKLQMDVLLKRLQ